MPFSPPPLLNLWPPWPTVDRSSANYSVLGHCPVEHGCPAFIELIDVILCNDISLPFCCCATVDITHTPRKVNIMEPKVMEFRWFSLKQFFCTNFWLPVPAVHFQNCRGEKTCWPWCHIEWKCPCGCWSSLSGGEFFSDSQALEIWNSQGDFKWNITPPKFNIAPKNTKRKLVFQPPFFRGYVKLRGGSWFFWCTFF